MKLYCKLGHAWGTKVKVCGVIYDIDPDDGMVDVTEEAAEKLLQNTNKWLDPEKEPDSPLKRPRSTASAAVLVDAQGNELSEAETQEAVDEAQADAEGGEDAETGETEEVADDVWPEVSMTSHTKPEMATVLDQLAEHGYDCPYEANDTKADLLEKIQKVYDKLE